MSVEQRIETLQKPGYGYGSGCTVLARKTGETKGVEWTRFTVEDNWTKERENIYMTESGWQVEPCTGSYGSGIRWSFNHVTTPGTLRFAQNLTQVFTKIARSAHGQEA